MGKSMIDYQEDLGDVVVDSNMKNYKFQKEYLGGWKQRAWMKIDAPSAKVDMDKVKTYEVKPKKINASKIDETQMVTDLNQETGRQMIQTENLTNTVQR